MKHKQLFALTMSVVAVFVLFTVAHADDSDQEKLVPYKQIATITVPSGLHFPGGGFDISWVDSETGRYYLADRGDSTATPPIAPSIDVIDTRHNKLLFTIPLTTAGNGVLAFHGSGDDEELDQGGTLVVGGANSTAIFIDLAHPFAVPLAVSTGGNHRADELAYDPVHKIILIANDQDTPHPFVTFISTANHAVLGKIVYDGSGPGNPLSTGGIEQPVWDGFTGRFYIAIPKTALNTNGEIDEINPTTRMITRIFATTCGPAGLALIPGQRLITSCGDVVDIASWTLVTHVAGVGADEIWFNPGDERVYFGGFTSVPVVNGLPTVAAPHYSVIATLPWTGVFHIPPPPPPVFQFSHSIAADRELNRVFLPVTNVGVLVFTDDRDNGEGPDK